ncbi:MAG TPA: hypothetical protein VJ576_01040 [Rhodocyclaceae bacterium]|nr:hypothetical protein [Rhodocyclaceae bacterium]
MPQHHDALTAAYGFGLFPLPAYRPARRGDWRVATHLPSIGDGYVSTAAVEARAVLSRGREVWMSTGLLEQESHAWHVHCARGVVVTAGLGLGMYAYAAAMKPEVDLVVAADISTDVIALMAEAAGFGHWPCRDKMRIVEADALGPAFPAAVAEATGGRPVDYFYADIWPAFPAAEAPAQTAEMVCALGPRAAGWWGQELSFAEHCRARHRPADEDGLRAYFTETGVPAPPFTAGYAAFCRDAMAAYGLGEGRPFWRRLRQLLNRC